MSNYHSLHEALINTIEEYFPQYKTGEQIPDFAYSYHLDRLFLVFACSDEETRERLHNIRDFIHYLQSERPSKSLFNFLLNKLSYQHVLGFFLEENNKIGKAWTISEYLAIQLEKELKKLPPELIVAYLVFINQQGLVDEFIASSSRLGTKLDLIPAEDQHEFYIFLGNRLGEMVEDLYFSFHHINPQHYKQLFSFLGYDTMVKKANHRSIFLKFLEQIPENERLHFIERVGWDKMRAFFYGSALVKNFLCLVPKEHHSLINKNLFLYQISFNHLNTKEICPYSLIEPVSTVSEATPFNITLNSDEHFCATLTLANGGCLFLVKNDYKYYSLAYFDVATSTKHTLFSSVNQHVPVDNLMLLPDGKTVLAWRGKDISFSRDTIPCNRNYYIVLIHLANFSVQTILLPFHSHKAQIVSITPYGNNEVEMTVACTYKQEWSRSKELITYQLKYEILEQKPSQNHPTSGWSPRIFKILTIDNDKAQEQQIQISCGN